MQKTESSKGSKGFPLPIEQKPSNPRTEAKWAFSRSISMSWPAQPKRTSCQSWAVSMGADLYIRMQRQYASERCMERLEWVTHSLSDPRLYARVGIHHEQGECHRAVSSEEGMGVLTSGTG